MDLERVAADGDLSDAGTCAARPAGPGWWQLLADLVPASASVAEAIGDVTDLRLFPATDVRLFPDEEAAISRAVDKRRREFTAVRGCARRALARLGQPAVPIVPGTGGAPQWPPGVVGSMTHCAGYTAAVVARAQDVLALGVDAEPDDVLPDGVLDLVSLPQEREMLTALASQAPGPSWDRLLFSAKESVYKTWFPLTQRWLGFEEALISVDPDNGTFTARLLVPGPVLADRQIADFSGRWLVRSGFVLTAIAVLPHS